MAAMSVASILLIFNAVREFEHVGSEFKDLVDRVEKGEEITLAELQLAEEAQVEANDELQDMD